MTGNRSRTGYALGALAWTVPLTVPLTVVLTLLFCASAFGSVGQQLASFVPEPARNGRGLAISGSTAYISSQDEKIYEVNLASHATIGSLETLSGAPSGYSALTFDPQGQLWGGEYTESEGSIDKVNAASGSVEKIFNAKKLDANNIAIDGLSADSDGTLWLKGEGDKHPEGTIYHVNATGEELGHCTINIESPGFVVDGSHLWVAEGESGGRIVEYEKPNSESKCLPVSPEVSFPTGTVGATHETLEPEGLALDHCTFPGHLALWIYGASLGGGPLVAYDLGPDSDTTGCPPREEPKGEGGNGSAGNGSAGNGSGGNSSTSGSGSRAPGLYVGGSGGSDGAVVAGAPTLLEYLDPNDPTGLLFVYIWYFGDGSRLTGHARVHHTYKCAGIYDVTATEIDTSGARHMHAGELAVGFPKSANKSYQGLRFSPHVHVSGHTASAWLSWSGRGKRHIKARTVDWTIDRTHRRRSGISTHAKSSLSLHRNHGLTATVHFSNRHNTIIHACFYA